MSELNLRLFELVHQFAGRNPFLDDAGIFFAEYAPYLSGVLFLVFLARHAKDWRMRVAVFADAAIAVLLARGIVVEIIRFFLPIARPFAALEFKPFILETSSAFPSAHAAIFFALAMIVMFYNKKMGMWFFAFALVNGVARVFVGVHWPLDIVGGALAGIGGAVIVHGVLKEYIEGIRGRGRVPS